MSDIDPEATLTVPLTQEQTWIIEQAVLIERQRAREDGREEVAELCTEIHNAMIESKIRAANLRQAIGGED